MEAPLALLTIHCRAHHQIILHNCMHHIPGTQVQVKHYGCARCPCMLPKRLPPPHPARRRMRRACAKKGITRAFAAACQSQHACIPPMRSRDEGVMAHSAGRPTKALSRMTERTDKGRMCMGQGPISPF